MGTNNCPNRECRFAGTIAKTSAHTDSAVPSQMRAQTTAKSCHQFVQVDRVPEMGRKNTRGERLCKSLQEQRFQDRLTRRSYNQAS
jgi:hypothetical protein